MEEIKPWISNHEWYSRYSSRVMGIAIRHGDFTRRKALAFGLGTRNCGIFLAANGLAVKQGSEGIREPWIIPWLTMFR